jgi:2-amino-4,5-dihydroxy-6-oxo-7-(phosphooxy)heptanoate synthase
VPFNESFARRLRLDRMYRHNDQRLLVVPLDHSITDGPILGDLRLDNLLGCLADNRVDAVVLHKGSLRHVDHRWFARMSLIVHLSASTMHAPDPDAKYLVAGVEEALRAGADAVSVHVNLGSRQEMRQVSDLASVADACDRWNVPLLAMMYPRGPGIDNPRSPELVAHAVTLAADLGADLVKVPVPDPIGAMTEITRSSPIPILAAGGPRRKDLDGLIADAECVLRTGVTGFAMGRNIFCADDPGVAARCVVDVVHSTQHTTQHSGLRRATPVAVA